MQEFHSMIDLFFRLTPKYEQFHFCSYLDSFLFQVSPRKPFVLARLQEWDTKLYFFLLQEFIVSLQCVLYGLVAHFMLYTFNLR